jgi:hypothetical protein
VVAEQVIGRSFLARALAAIADPSEAERIEAGLMVLVNKILAAGRAKPGHAEVVNRGALYATATLALGLETVARGDVERATRALGSIALERLFRVGYTVTQKLARLAVALAPRSVTSGSPVKELVAALCSPRPLFACAADEPPATGVRPFESAADLRRAGELLAGLTVRIALLVFGGPNSTVLPFSTSCWLILSSALSSVMDEMLIDVTLPRQLRGGCWNDGHGRTLRSPGPACTCRAVHPSVRRHWRSIRLV